MACSLFLVINNDHSNRDSDYVFNVDVIVTNRESYGISAEKKRTGQFCSQQEIVSRYLLIYQQFDCLLS